nr:sigma-54 dependent transcriptional regulator [uncultured Desulfuromonas sp.]
MAESILLIDDDASMRRVIEFTLQEAGYQVLTAESGEQALPIFRQHQPALVITDVRMEGMSGYQVLEKVLAESPETLVMIITAYSTVEQAVGAMKSGAYDYLTKPFSGEQLRLAVARAFEYRALHRENCQLHEVLQRQDTSQPIVGKSAALHQVLEQVDKVALSLVPVLITGESGTGKELVARRIHQASSRRMAPFVAINCAAIPHDLLESELFGHVKGAFTGAIKDQKGRFELADGGTLFLDEIAEMPLALQPKLLRALQERQIEPLGGQPRHIDVRLVAATNRDLPEEIAQQRFRQDLYYRLAVVPLKLPPLRERREDIPLLVNHFIAHHPQGRGVQVSDALYRALADYAWPGNIRELHNVIEQMLILRQHDRLDLKDLPSHITGSSVSASPVLQLPAEGYSLEEIERQAVIQAMQYCQGNKSRAAAFLRIPRHTLLYRLEKYAIDQWR